MNKYDLTQKSALELFHHLQRYRNSLSEQHANKERKIHIGKSELFHVVGFDIWSIHKNQSGVANYSDKIEMDIHIISSENSINDLVIRAVYQDESGINQYTGLSQFIVANNIF